MKRMMLILIAASFAASVLPGFGRTLHVDAESTNPVPPYTDPTEAALTINDALGEAVSGDRILVAPGTYPRFSMDRLDLSLELIGVGGPDKVIIDGESEGRCFYFRNDNAGTFDLSISGMTFSNGVTTVYGGGVFIRYRGNSKGTARLTNVVIVDNKTTSGSSNDHGGGGFYWRADEVNPGFPRHLILSNVTIRANQALSADGENGTRGRGGGAYFRGGTVHVTNSQFIGNEAQAGGGGIRFDGTNAELFDTHVEQNRQIGPQNRSGGGLWTDGSSIVLLDRCFVQQNHARLYAGGFMIDGGTVTLRNTLINANQGFRAGGIWQGGGTLLVENSTIVGNLSVFGSGGGSGGIRVMDGYCAVTNSIVYANWDEGSGDHNTRNVDVIAFSCTTAPSPPAGLGNIEANPSFVADGEGFGLDHIPGDYRLAAGSPCIDAGVLLDWMHDADALDLARNPRVDRITGKVDMGAYEYIYAGTTILVR